MYKSIKIGTVFGGTNPAPKMLFWGLLLALFIEYARPGTYFGVLEVAKLNTVIPVTVFVFTLFSSSGGGLGIVNA